MKKNSAEILLERWRHDESAPMHGWDFSYIRNRMASESPPWDYTDIVREYLANAESAIDLETGGGEFLSSLKPLPTKMYATEGYAPNYELEKRRLSPLGIHVIHCMGDAHLSFPEGYFDVILNRHGTFNAVEIRRLLKPNGVFCTQQVGGKNLHDLISLFRVKKKSDWGAAKVQKNLTSDGLTIVKSEEWSGKRVFHDVGAIVYFLKAIQWLVPGFTVDKYKSVLYNLQTRLDQGELLAFTDERFLVIAKKVSK